MAHGFVFLVGWGGGGQGVIEVGGWTYVYDEAEEPWWDQILDRVIVVISFFQGVCGTERLVF